ncbi:hypothetical protein XELAEV_18021266mg [Xenopus laevis]|uniref:Fibronectin type-III domain-containing protein n=1 Tax=Xenopus laevis TaxID=8355 RepID=A0A974D8X5_XENLA|nr:hypothetical protein XELAEV_18021266mg [Xenopus laevis]
MDKYFLLLLFQTIVQGGHTLECDQTIAGTRAVVIEWNAFPEDQTPDFYSVIYKKKNATFKQNMPKASGNQQIYNSHRSLLHLEENLSYKITIESIKNGNVLTARSCLINVISVSDIKLKMTSTSVVFNWSNLNSDISVSIILNSTTREMSVEDKSYEWENLKPGTDYIISEYSKPYI